MDKLLSIIIPTYNMERYLNRCLDSLIVSDDCMEKLEVLVINDGSQDASSAIAREYETRYPQTYRVIDKPNGNYGSCINRGLMEMSGKYVRILDADDYYHTQNLDRFIHLLQEIDVDLVLSDMCSVYSSGSKLNLSFPFDDTLVYDANLLVRKEFKDKMEMHCVTYHKEVLTRISYWQTEGISYTDQEWIFYPMTSVNSVVYFPFVIYNYVLDREGQTMDVNVEIMRVGHKMAILNRMIDYMISNPSDGSAKGVYVNCRFGKLLRLVYKLVLLYQTDEQYKANVQALRTLDSRVRCCLPTLYEESYTYIISKEIPLRFVKYWREKDRRYPHILLSFHRHLKAMDVFLRKRHLRG